MGPIGLAKCYQAFLRAEEDGNRGGWDGNRACIQDASNTLRSLTGLRSEGKGEGGRRGRDALIRPRCVRPCRPLLARRALRLGSVFVGKRSE